MFTKPVSKEVTEKLIGIVRGAEDLPATPISPYKLTSKPGGSSTDGRVTQMWSMYAKGTKKFKIATNHWMSESHRLKSLTHRRVKVRYVNTPQLRSIRPLEM